MAYDELKRAVAKEFRFMQKEVNELFGINEENYDEKVAYCYYKKPFNDAYSNVEAELIVFTKSKHIVQAKPIYNEKNVFHRIDISISKVNDIDRISYVTSPYNRDIAGTLEIIFKDSNKIKLDSTDVNGAWQDEVSNEIRKIASYLLQEE
jgi:poly-D-alanine transfer protein DltD